MLKNRSMPSSTVIPELGYVDVRQAVDWLTHTFGFVERLRIGEHRAQLSFDLGDVVVMQTSDDLGAVGSSHAVMVRVSDVDAHFSRTEASGAKIVNQPSSFPYGERQYTAIDIGGHVWTFSQSIADVDPSSWGGELNEDAT